MTTARPLLHGAILQTKDLDEAASWLSDSAIPYVSELQPGSPSFSTQIFITRGQSVALSRVVTAGTMKVRSLLPEDAYAVVLDLRSGVGLHHVDKLRFLVGSEAALIQSPAQPVEVLTMPHFEVLFVRIACAALTEELQRLLGHPVQSRMAFAAEFRLRTAAGARLQELCQNLRRGLCLNGEQGIGESFPMQNLENDLMTLLVQAQPHNYTRLLNRGVDAGAWQLKAAEEYMRANVHLPISLGDVCQAAGVNARSLQESFRRKRSCTPMSFLRNLRMEGARTSLLQPTDNTTITGEAARWGFLHFGRFSGEYRERYGELPSETLRRSRRNPAQTKVG